MNASESIWYIWWSMALILRLVTESITIVKMGDFLGEFIFHFISCFIPLPTIAPSVRATLFQGPFNKNV